MRGGIARIAGKRGAHLALGATFVRARSRDVSEIQVRCDAKQGERRNAVRSAASASAALPRASKNAPSSTCVSGRDAPTTRLASTSANARSSAARGRGSSPASGRPASALAAAIRFHTVRYFGVLASASRWRPLIVPKPVPSEATDDAAAPCTRSPTAAPPSAPGSRYRPWAELLRKTFAVDVETCPRCGGRMRLLAVITDPQSVARFLRHRGEPTQPPARAPPRDPPYFKPLVVQRRHPGEPSTQGELFQEH